MLVKAYSAAVNGLEVTTITVEVSLTRGVSYRLTGLGDEAVRESRDRIAAALLNTGLKFPVADITANLSPASLRKVGSGFDLPLAVAILAANGDIPSDRLGSYMLVGELSLDGSLQPVKGVLPIAIRARKDQMKGLIVPKANEHEAAVVNQLDVYGMSSITAGGHNLVMIGPPGSGKSMMAKRLPSILPPLTLSESLETTQIHSIAGKLSAGKGLISQRPFRSPHHTISQVALVGGGVDPMPGEISLAHNGVLFADELPEFNKHTLEVLRQPLEDRLITIARAKYTITYPASFMFVASMNPCPCGYYGDPTHVCVCSPGQIQRYMNKISGPLLDRIDIQCEITPVPFKDISKAQPGEPSSAIRERVIKARQRQELRYKDIPGVHCNAQMTERMIHQYAEPDEAGISLLRMAMERLNLSARAYNRILKVARTIADIEGSEQLQPSHLAEAISYRNLDRSDWAERGV